MKSSVSRIVPLTRVHVQACEAIVSVSEPWKSLNETVDFRHSLERKPLFRSSVFLIDDEPAGFVLFTPEPVFARGGYLRAIGVAPRFRRKNIGKKLLSYAEQMTIEKAGYLFLCVSSFNRAAQTFYRKCGYTKAGRLPGLIIPGHTEFIYWKKLRKKRA